MTAGFVDLAVAYEKLRRALETLPFPHAFIGAMAVLAWARPRATSDLDLVLACGDAGWDRLVEALAAEGFELKSKAGPADPSHRAPDIGFFWLRGPHPLRVDVFVAKTAFEEAVLATSRETDVLGGPMRVASPEASIVYKLLASRTKDLADLEVLFETRALAEDRLDWDFIEKWAREWGMEDRLAPYAAKYRIR